MSSKSKFLVFIGSFLIVLYGASAFFYGQVIAKDAYKELGVFIEVLNRIDTDYVEAPNMNKVQEGAMRGLIDAMDPYSSFLSKQKYDELQKKKGENKAGLGVALSKRSDVISIVACERDGAAAQSGIRSGDYVIAVNGQNVENESIMEVDSRLHGAAGEKVKLSIFRSSKNKPLSFELSFKNPSENLVVSKMLDGNVGLLDILTLEDAAVEQAKIKLKTLISAGAKKFVLDLRNCATGRTENGGTLANYFLKSGTIYYSQNKSGEKMQIVQARPELHISDEPLAVLIDNTTAGAAEIAAGALKDAGRATVIGEKSFGIGSVQKTIALKSGAVLTLSIAKYFTPSGKVIQDETASKTGIIPDIQAPDEEKHQDLAVESYYDDKEDAEKYRQLQQKIEKIQLDKAIELLTSEKAVKKLLRAGNSIDTISAFLLV